MPLSERLKQLRQEVGSSVFDTLYKKAVVSYESLSAEAKHGALRDGQHDGEARVQPVSRHCYVEGFIRANLVRDYASGVEPKPSESGERPDSGLVTTLQGA